ncbi:MAG: hypothetical protein HY286_01735 [Planctomycetes bacterium]|nr:hypothetical protein [Planctomycetota bacterium]
MSPTYFTIPCVLIFIIFASRQQKPAVPKPAAESQPADWRYRVIKKIALPAGMEPDCIAVDDAARRIYVGGAARILVFDADNGKAAGEIGGLTGAAGIAIASGLKLAFVNDLAGESVAVFDTKTQKQVEKVKIGAGAAAAIIYDPSGGQVLIFNNNKKATAIVAATPAAGAARAVRSMDVGGIASSAVADGAGRVFAALSDTNEIVVIDSKKLNVAARWPVAPGERPAGLALDIKNKGLFITCGNREWLMMNLTNGAVTKRVELRDGAGACAYDPVVHYAFSANADGTLGVANEETPESFWPIWNAATPSGSTALALDPKTHNIFVPSTASGEKVSYISVYANGVYNSAKPLVHVAADGFPEGQETPEGAACDLARAFINRDVKLFTSTCVPVYGGASKRDEYKEFLKTTREGIEAEAAKKEPSGGGPKAIAKVFAARFLSKDGPSSYAYAMCNFEEVMFVDVGASTVEGGRFLNRTLVIKKKDGKWYVQPAPETDPLLSVGLNDESPSKIDFAKVYDVEK